MTLESLFRLLPPQEELEELRHCLTGAAIPDPAKEWSKSRAYATIDKRVLELEALNGALAQAERAHQEYVTRLFTSLRGVLDAAVQEQEAEAAFRLVGLGELQESRGQHRRARKVYETALAASLPLADKAPQILALRRVARSHLALGELNEALTFYQRSAQLARDAGDLRGEVIARTGEGNVRSVQGWWAESEQCYRPALEAVEGSAAPEELALEHAQLCNNLGLVSIRLDRRDEAEAWLGRALELWRQLDADDDLGICYHNLAMLREQQGRWEEAQRIREQALELDLAPGPRAVIAIDLAQGWVRLEQLSEAERWGRVAEQQAIAARSPYHLGHMYRGLGNIARARGDADGLTFFEKALEVARDCSLPYLEGETLIDYAGLRAQSGEAEEAEAYLQRAIQIFDRLEAVYERERARIALEELANLSSLPAAD
jgi:tetratricopeptide (TPR) repeat protein